MQAAKKMPGATKRGAIDELDTGSIEKDGAGPQEQAGRLDRHSRRGAALPCIGPAATGKVFSIGRPLPCFAGSRHWSRDFSEK
jgi:hypothetical protein